MRLIPMRSVEREIKWLVNQLSAVREQGGGDDQLRECAVLCRYNSQVEEVEAALDGAGGLVQPVAPAWAVRAHVSESTEAMARERLDEQRRAERMHKSVVEELSLIHI